MAELFENSIDKSQHFFKVVCILYSELDVWVYFVDNTPTVQLLWTVQATATALPLPHPLDVHLINLLPALVEEAQVFQAGCVVEGKSVWGRIRGA